MGLFLVWITIFTGLRVVNSRDFTYKGSMGPDHWAEEFSTCSGKYQSPINIQTHDVEKHDFPSLDLDRFTEKPTGGTVMNNGHTVVLNFTYKQSLPFLAGGPLGNHTYQFLQMHFHWGSNDLEGSEDRINNKSFAAEVHIVMKNLKYKDFDEATKHKDGLAVLASFLSVEKYDNPNYVDFCNLLDQIQKPNSSVHFPDPPPLTGLMPLTPTGYYTYNGSLTTPPCSEDVIWIDFSIPVSISEDQINRLRSVSGSDGNPLKGNFRPVQPINNRTIYLDYRDEYLGGIPFIKSGSTSMKISLINVIYAIIFIKYIV